MEQLIITLCTFVVIGVIASKEPYVLKSFHYINF